MKTKSFSINPVLFLIFNRPDNTQIVFDAIRKAKPPMLFVSADGPRDHISSDQELCEKTREIIKQVDWDCEVFTKFHEKNLGLKRCVSSALNWFFENVEEGIILEDDCLPDPTFFKFCKDLLEKYRDDQRVMQISGNNFLFDQYKIDASYYFSKINDIWGWATWRRAWKLYDINMKSFPEFKEKKQLANYIENPKIRDWFMAYFENDFGALNTRKGIWSTQWSYAICISNGLTIVPKVNLVSNVGMTGESTNETNTYDLYANVPSHPIENIQHPEFVLPNITADNIRFEIIKKTDPIMIYSKRIKFKSFLKKHLPPKVVQLLKNKTS